MFNLSVGDSQDINSGSIGIPCSEYGFLDVISHAHGWH